jgi:hypothetical protein
MLFDGEKSLRPNEAGVIELAAFTIAFIQWNGEGIPVRAARDLAKNQIRAWKIGDDQCSPPLSAIASRERNDNDFAGYRFDHAVSSSGEFQSRPRTDSLSSAPLNAMFSSESFEACSFWPKSDVLIKQFSHVLPRNTPSTLRKSLVQTTIRCRCQKFEMARTHTASTRGARATPLHISLRRSS